MTDLPDFEALRAERNNAMMSLVEELAAKLGTTVDQCQHTFDLNACYCACPKGPCEHDFKGGRPLYDDQENECGFETVCTRCGMGAMSHDMRCCEM